MSAHSPGPFSVLHETAGVCIVDANGAAIACVYSLETPDAVEANAALLARAPDLLRERDELLAALKGAVIAMHPIGSMNMPADVRASFQRVMGKWVALVARIEAGK